MSDDETNHAEIEKLKNTLRPRRTRPLRIGEDVFFFLAYGPRKGEPRPAKVVRHVDGDPASACLVVFTAGPDDGVCYAHHPELVTATYDAAGSPGSWRREP